MSSTKLFFVAGNPILHSKSPDMFLAAFRACAMDALYLRFASSKTEEIVQTARNIGILGFNITSPYKEEILPYPDDVEETARKSGAVNTIVLGKGKFEGFNTDIEGVKKALLVHGVVISGKKALVLGAGGAAKAAVFALVAEGAKVTIINRTFEKAQSIARTLSCEAAPMEIIEQKMEGVDILISCLSENKHIVPSRSLTENLVVLDAHYREETQLVCEAKAKGCMVIDGREWLLYQGAQAFSHFTGQKPPVAVMRRALYDDRPFIKRNIALVGFMGAGKSTVGRHLAGMLKMSHIDIDSVIAQKQGSSIENIFEQRGEEAFRRMEEKEIHSAANMSGRMISCGGGAVLNKTSMDRLRKHTLVVWLNAGVDTILQRTVNDMSRPLLNVQDRKTAVDKMLRIRENYYAYASDFFINTDEKEPVEIAKRIYDESNTSLGN
jgi:shikimate dehydrogenase